MCGCFQNTLREVVSCLGQKRLEEDRQLVVIVYDNLVMSKKQVPQYELHNNKKCILNNNNHDDI